MFKWGRSKIGKRSLFTIILLGIAAGLIGYGCSRKGEERKMREEDSQLIIYTPHPTDFIRPLICEFEGRTGIKVLVHQGVTGELLKQIQEGQPADIMWGGSLFSVMPYKDYFGTYRTENEPYFETEFQNKEKNMTRFTDIPSVLIVNQNLIGDIPVESYEDLLNPELAGKIAFADPSLSSSSYEHLINMLYDMGNGAPEDGWSYVKKLCSNLNGTLLGSSSEVYHGVAEGRFVVGLTFEEAAANLIKQGKPLKIVYMKEGVVSTPDGVYLIKHAAHTQNAEAFIDFITGCDAQTMIAADLGRRSIRKDVAFTKGIPSKDEFKKTSVNVSEVVENRDQWLAKFSQIYEESTHEK